VDKIYLWHNRRDTPLAVVHDEAEFVSLRLPIGVWPGQLTRHNITLEYRIEPKEAFLVHLVEDPPNSPVEPDGAARIGLNPDNRRGSIKRITSDTIAALREDYPNEAARTRPYYDLDWIFQNYQPAPAYYEATLHHIPVGATVHYQIKLYSHNAQPLVDPADNTQYQAFAAPVFGLEDVKWCKSQAPMEEFDTVVYWKPSGDDGDYVFRFDFMRTDHMWDDFYLKLANAASGDKEGRLESRNMPIRANDHPSSPTSVWPPQTPLSQSWPFTYEPVVDRQFDTVTVRLTAAELAQDTRIGWWGEEIGQVNAGGIIPSQPGPFHPIRLMFIHYANQSVNDLFESPNKNYTPGRSYMQTTLRDERGTYCSRPDATDQGLPAGYMFALEAHARTQLPCVVALSGSCLSLIAQDHNHVYRGKPIDDLDCIKKYIDLGLMEPAIGGLAGHKMLYFHRETNAFALKAGIEWLENILCMTAPVVYPNSRLYAANENIDRPILDARISKPLTLSEQDGKRHFAAGAVPSKVRYVVVDQQGFSLANIKGPRPAPIWGQKEHAYLWRQQCRTHRGTQQACSDDGCDTWYWLFIDQDAKNNMVKDDNASGGTVQTNEFWEAGKLSEDMRHELIYGFSEQLSQSLVVYSDDIEHFSANGWFDGDYNGKETDWVGIANAALEWIAAHPWIRVVTTADLDPATDCVGTVFVEGAIDPSIHQDFFDPTEESWAARYTDDFDRWSREQVARTNGFVYGWWYRVWRDTRSAWLDKRFAEISEALEQAIMMHPPEKPNSLDTLAQIAYTLAQHEACWNKQPLEAFVPKEIYDNPNNKDNRKQLNAFQRLNGNGVLDPEDFIWCASLQVRNAHVFRCAAAWPRLLDQLTDGATRCNSDPLFRAIEDLRKGTCQHLVQPNVRPGLQWDLDVTENVVLYNNKLLVVMDSNGGRITHVFAMHDGEPVVISGTVKAYQFLGDERQYGGQLPSDGAVLQNTVFVPSHRYIASDVAQSRSTKGEKYNRKPHIVDDGGPHYEDKQFGAEDWLYPDNFNCYKLQSHDDHSATWAFPGNRWDIYKADPMNVGKFTQLMAAYRAFIQELPGRNRLIEAHLKSTKAAFTKTITLDGNTIRVAYAGTLHNHLVANEFSLDHLSMLTDGAMQTRTVIDEDHEIRLQRDDLTPQLAVTIRLGPKCHFSEPTLRDDKPGGKPKDRRLHRAFSDCVEVESTADGDFDYTITVG
jgi:hypothetical protein